MIRNEDEGGQAEVVWTCHEGRPGVHRKKGDGNGVTGKKEKRKAKEKISIPFTSLFGKNEIQFGTNEIQFGMNEI